jgi:hypothetical protein
LARGIGKDYSKCVVSAPDQDTGRMVQLLKMSNYCNLWHVRLHGCSVCDQICVCSIHIHFAENQLDCLFAYFFSGYTPSACLVLDEIQRFIGHLLEVLG